MGRFSLIVFDLDGTLVDSLRDLADAANELLEECGHRPHPEDAIGRMVGDGAATLVARAFAAAGAVAPPDALERFLAIYDARLLRFTRPYPGVATLLEEVRPVAQLAVLTNKPLAATQSILDGLGLAPYFEGRVRGGDGPLPRKPHPAGLLDLTGGVVAPASTLMVGDSPVDVKTARAAGTRCCIARYGFGAAAFEGEGSAAADYAVDHPLDLRSLLL